MTKKKTADNSLDKTLDKKIHGYFREYTKIIIDAINFWVEKNEGEHKELFRRIYSLEQRVSAIENILTDHGKMLRDHGRILRDHGKLLREQRIVLANHGIELKKIRELLDKIQKQESVNENKIILLEQRVENLEAKVL